MATKTIEDKTFMDLGYDDLVAHAGTLGELTNEAFDFLDELAKRKKSFTEKMKATKRSKLRKQYKKYQVKDENGKVVRGQNGKIEYKKIDERLYTDKEIEDMLSEIKEVSLTLTEIKELYCNQYWEEMKRTKKGKKAETLTEKVAAARKKLKAANKK